LSIHILEKVAENKEKRKKKEGKVIDAWNISYPDRSGFGGEGELCRRGR
jgi:hypothetical protein